MPWPSSAARSPGTTSISTTEEVVPILAGRGIVRTEYESSTRRGNLGLPVPENRYTRARAQHPAVLSG